MARKRLGTMLIEAGVLSEAALRTALAEQRRWGGSLGRALVEMKLIGEAELVRVLAVQLKVPTIDLDAIDIPNSVTELVPADLAQQHALIPFAQPMKFLDVAMADPTNEGILDELRIRTRLNIRPHLVGPKAIERAIGKYYQRGFSPYRRGDASVTMPVETYGGAIELDLAEDPVPVLPMTQAEEELAALQDRVSKLEARVALDIQVLQKMIALLVDKQVATREEIIERLRP